MRDKWISSRFSSCQLWKWSLQSCEHVNWTNERVNDHPFLKHTSLAGMKNFLILHNLPFWNYSTLKKAPFFHQKDYCIAFFIQTMWTCWNSQHLWDKWLILHREPTWEDASESCYTTGTFIGLACTGDFDTRIVNKTVWFSPSHYLFLAM